MTMVRAGEAELFYEVIGSGSPVLMLHGLGLDHTYLRPWHDPLADVARLIYYDQRWNGRSARVGPSDHATWQADAIALLDQLGEQRSVVYGHSYGAWLALGLALRYPERVSGLILCGSSPAFDYADQVVASALARDPVAASALIGGFGAPVPSDTVFETLWREILPLYFAGEPRPDILANTIFSSRGFNAGIECLAGFTVEPQLSELRMPILLVTGKHDFITPPSQALRIAAGAPHAKFVELARSGHFPFVEEQTEYLQTIRDWLRSVAA